MEIVSKEVQAEVDVIVVGGGAAGLSAATALARSLRSVVVVDGGEPRNAPSSHAHNVFTRDGAAPAELLRLAREEADHYGVTVIPGRASTASREEGGTLTVDLAGGDRLRGRRLLLATGLSDELPDVPGVRELWGKDVLHCPYCHGWEVRGQRIGVLGTGPGSAHQALMFRQLSPDVTFFQHDAPALSEVQAEQLRARGIRVVANRVVALAMSEGRLQGIELDGGDQVPLDVVTVSPRFTARAEIFSALGGVVEKHPAGVGTYVPTDPAGRTAVDGVWAAGNVTDLAAMVAASAGAGVSVAAAINSDLVLEDVRRAVALAV